MKRSSWGAPPIPRAALVLAAVLASVSCKPQATAITTPLPAERGPALRYSFTAIDGRPISSESMRNRLTVIAFLTTYDVHSQAEARYLAMLEAHHVPRINAAALMLEAPENRPLVEAFVASLGLTYPIALADAATIAGEGPFAGLHHVPSVVVLDRQGHEAWRHVGFVDEATLDAALKELEKRLPPPSPEAAPPP